MQGEIASKWCRENLNELGAEKELRTTRKGTFLVWRGRSPVDLYLSYIDHDGISHHLPIKQLGRLFFLEGVRFHSLSQVVVYHLTWREHSDSPVKISNSQKREKLEATHIALVDTERVPGSPEFSVARGDLLSEVGRIDDRWLLAKHLPSESLAFFDLTETSVLSDMDAAPDALPYFHADATAEDQEELVQRLADGGPGSFLLRRSKQTGGAYALLVHTGEKIDKFLVEQVRGLPQSPSNNNNNAAPSVSNGSSSTVGWRLSGRVFGSISQIVHRYSIRPMQAEARLTHAVLAPAIGEECGESWQREGTAASCPCCTSSSAAAATSAPSCSTASSCSHNCSNSSNPYGAYTAAASTSAAAAATMDQSCSCSTVAGCSSSSNYSSRDVVEKEYAVQELQDERVLVASVHAHYKVREDKEWRRCALMLIEHAGSAVLRIKDTGPRSGSSSNESRQQQSLLLQHTELHCLHESCFGREATVFLAPLQNEPVVFLAFEPLHFHYTWFHLLRRYTVQRRVDGGGGPLSYYGGAGERAEMSVLSVHVDKYKGESLKADTTYRVGIALNGVGVAWTAGQLPATGSSVVFDAHFLIMVTSWSCALQLTLHAAGKSRPTAVSATLAVPCSSMAAAAAPSAASAAAAIVETERKPERKTSSSSAPSTSSGNPFTVTTTRTRVVVLGRDAYTPLLDSLLPEVLPVAEWACGRLQHGQRNLLCSLIVSLVWPHSLRALIECTLGRSIEETNGENMLRQDSFASCLITAALRASGKAALEARLAEERPKKEGQSEEWLVSVLTEIAAIPSVSLVLACVAATVAAHFPEEGREHWGRRAISAAFILRFANPLVITCLPATEGPQLARAIQTAANAAATNSFVRDPSGSGIATRLFDLFERIRESALQTVMVEAYDTAPEQCALLCHLLTLALSSCPAGSHSPASSSIAFSTSTCSSSNSSTGSGVMTSSTSFPTAAAMQKAVAAAGGVTEMDGAHAAGLSSSMSTVSSSVYSSSSSSSTHPPHTHPELTPFLARLLEMHRS